MSPKESPILLVDDEPVITRTLCHYLKLAGYSNVRPENDPLQVVSVIGEFEPKVLLLDISMPQLNGLKILEQLSDRIVDDSITVIMVTSSEEEFVKRKALILGACDFISKPVNPRELVERLENALAGRPNLEFILRSLPAKSPHTVDLSNTPPFFRQG